MISSSKAPMTQIDVLLERISRLEASLAIITLEGRYARTWWMAPGSSNSVAGGRCSSVRKATLASFKASMFGIPAPCSMSCFPRRGITGVRGWAISDDELTLRFTDKAADDLELADSDEWVRFPLTVKPATGMNVGDRLRYLVSWTRSPATSWTTTV